MHLSNREIFQESQIIIFGIKIIKNRRFESEN